MNIEIFTLLLAATVTAGTSILYATVGAIVVEKSGVVQLGVEGLMLIGALAGFAVMHFTDSLGLAVIAAFGFAALAGSVHAFISVYMQGNQVVSGLALTMFGIGVTALLGKPLVAVTNRSFSLIELPLLSKLPILGKAFFTQNIMVYASYLLVFVLWIFFYKTKMGLYLRTTGEKPGAADASGVPVKKIRFWATVVGSGISGLGGAYLSLFYIPFWTENMTAGRGWIAVALVIFSSWSTSKALLGAYFFGGIGALQLRLQALGATVPAQFLTMMPYLFTIIVLVISSLRGALNKQPTSLGVPYDREDRR